MTGTFSRYEDLSKGISGAFEALIHCIHRGICVSGDCVEWLIDNHPELVSDEYYVDFEDSSRWSIGKAYILALDGGFYRCWEEVGLTEMQPNEWWDQTFEPVHMKEVTVSTWVTDEEDN